MNGSYAFVRASYNEFKQLFVSPDEEVDYVARLDISRGLYNDLVHDLRERMPVMADNLLSDTIFCVNENPQWEVVNWQVSLHNKPIQEVQDVDFSE